MRLSSIKMKIKLALIQADLVWENPKENLKSFDKQLANLATDTEIVILPEVFATGFTMDISKFNHSIGVEALSWLKQKASEFNKIFVGSFLIKENGNYYNRMYWVRPDSSFDYYDKRHLFQMGGEHKVITAGEKRTIVDYKGVKFMFQICYDLRFPIFARNKFNKQTNTHDYDVLLYVANWPESRKDTYNTLLKARAIENQAYVVWVNRIGTDGHNIVFSGDSQIVSPYGKVTEKMQAHKAGILYSELDLQDLQDFRASYKIGLDWD